MFYGPMMIILWTTTCLPKIGPEELLKGGCENAASLICRNWAGIIVKGRILPAATKHTLFAAAYGRGPYIFEVIYGAPVMIDAEFL